MKQTSFNKFAWFVLAYNILVIAWGAFVRASFSGDGCGKNWPLCDGQLIPTNASVHRLIEFSHRASSGLVLVLTGAMFIWSFKAFKKGEQGRKASFFSFFFTISEALLGLGLVWFKLVAHDESVFRAVAMSAHLTNTLLLLASVTIAAISVPAPGEGLEVRLRNQGAALYAIGFGALCIIALGISGAISALGHTVEPSDNVIQAALAPGANYLNRLPPLHPLIAVSVGVYLLLMGGWLIHRRPSEKVKNMVQWTMIAYVAQLALGLLNIAIRAPIWLQLIHLAAADWLWITFILTAVTALSSGAAERQVDSAALGSTPKPKFGKVLIKQYVALTKPRVISLLLFTTVMAMLAAHDAAHPLPSVWLILWVAIGGYMAAGAANAINMVIDRDIDGTMKRTAGRPTVTQDISTGAALTFGLLLECGSFAILWGAANLLSAMMALAGLLYYVIVYTMLLKRRTWHNIVIGGAAGCFPPLVGWTAVTNELNPLALVLFAIIFVWTPVHFWALALLIKDDYAAAGVPMLPVVRGDRVTVVQISLYTVLTVIVSALPFLQREASWFYLAGVMVLNAILVLRCLQLVRTTARPQASSLFHYSMLYLALLFLVIAVDRAAMPRPATSRPAKVAYAPSQGAWSDPTLRQMGSQGRWE